MPRRRTSRVRNTLAYLSVTLAAIGLVAPFVAVSAIMLGFASLDLTVGPSVTQPSTWVHIPFAVMPILCGTTASSSPLRCVPGQGSDGDLPPPPSAWGCSLPASAWSLGSC